MEIENILIIVVVYNQGVPLGHPVSGGEFYKAIIERARDLLTTIHDEIVKTQQQNEKSKQDSSRGPQAKVMELPLADKEPSKGMRGRSPFKMGNLGKMGSTQFEMFDDPNVVESERQTDLEIVGRYGQLGEAERKESSKEVEESLRTLQKSHIAEIRAA